MNTTKQIDFIRQMPSAEIMYRALLQRDAQFEGQFFVGVKTTGIYCRPTCSARKPNRENVEFYPSSAAALHAGYRPCKVCQPTVDNAKPPAWVNDLLTWVEDTPADTRIRDCDLRDRAIDPARARRYFLKHYGMTFQAFQRARRLGSAMREVRQGVSIATAPYRNGYRSDSGFRDAFTKMFGDPPSRATERESLSAHWLESPVGSLLIVASERGICLLEFVDRRALESELDLIRQRCGAVIVPGTNQHIEQLERELAAYFNGELRNFRTSLDPHGTPFQQIVWDQLGKIPYGETMSYSAMARAINRNGAQRAIGRANGQNRIAIVIPCHRVIRENGELCGYGGGVWRKKWLLEHEHASLG